MEPWSPAVAAGAELSADGVGDVDVDKCLPIPCNPVKITNPSIKSNLLTAFQSCHCDWSSVAKGGSVCVSSSIVLLVWIASLWMKIWRRLISMFNLVISSCAQHSLNCFTMASWWVACAHGWSCAPLVECCRASNLLWKLYSTISFQESAGWGRVSFSALVLYQAIAFLMASDWHWSAFPICWQSL